MKKTITISVLLLVSLSYVSAFEVDLGGLDTLGDDISADVMGNLDGLDKLGDDISADVMGNIDDMMADFGTWQENFDSMMKDFQTNLENDLNQMTKRINSIEDGMMSDLDTHMIKLEKNLNGMLTELPNRFTSKLDTKLVTFFDTLESKSITGEKYMDNLNNLKDKIEELNKSGKFDTELLNNTVGYLSAKTDIEKNKLVKNEINKVKTKIKNPKDLKKEELESIKELFDSLEAEIN